VTGLYQHDGPYSPQNVVALRNSRGQVTTPQTGTPTGGSVVPSDGPGAPPVVPGPSRSIEQLMAEACLLPPLEVCGAPSPKGSWRCVRSPHPRFPDNHVFGRSKGGRK
jgi:hypothetical protein